MELAFEQKQRSCLHRTAHLSLAQEQTQELIIPDSMPDASRTLICCAEPEVQSKTNREGSLLVTGTLRTGCLYADEAGGLQLLTSELPFTVKLECAELCEDTQTLVRCCVRSADSRLINSRKVLLRVSVLVQADGYEPQTQSMSVLKDPPACLQLKTQTYETNAPVELSERAFQVSEELNLPDGRPQIARLVSCLLTPVVQEQGLVGSKAVLKGTANLQITYLDNENALRTLSFSVPFSQYCQMEGDYDQDETLESVLLVTGVQLEPVASEQSQKLLFGAGLVLYFAPRKKTPILMTGAVLAVTASCLSKDMGFALCLIAAAIICFDLLFVQKEDVPFFRLKGLGGKLCWCATLVGAPLAAFFGWAAHMSVVLGSNRFDIGGSADMGMVQMVTTGIAELLGIGRNAHIGFNEPDSCFACGTHQVTLTESTIAANTRFFENEAQVPRKAYSMGMQAIMQAKRVLLIASGADKAEAIRNSFFGPVTPQVPASILQLHRDVIVIADEAALADCPAEA